jgi:hypothetical protein
MSFKVSQRKQTTGEAEGRSRTQQPSLASARPFAVQPPTPRYAPATETSATQTPETTARVAHAAHYGHNFGRVGVLRSNSAAVRSKGEQGLPDRLKAGIERLSGMAMGDVRVHYNSRAPERVEALAHTQGRDIHLGAGQERHLAHEAWHVVQQKQGRVKATTQLKGVGVNDDSALEREADVMGARAARMSRSSQMRRHVEPGRSDTSRTRVEHTPLQRRAAGVNGQVIQRMKIGEEHVGQRFRVMPHGGQNEVEATYKEHRGGGWHAFEGDDKSEVLVRGQDNILGHAEAQKKGKKRKKMDAQSRLKRAHDRDKTRHPIWPDLSTRVDAPTPFGMTGLSRQRFSPTEPQTTTRESDFPGTQATGAAYTGWATGVGKQSDFKKMMSVVDKRETSPPKSFTTQQNRYASTLFGTTHYSEPRRFHGASKPARSAMRLIGEGKYKPSEFLDLFPMAQDKGSHFYEDALKGNQDMSKKQKRVLEEMSDSSDEENEDWWHQKKKRKPNK